MMEWIQTTITNAPSSLGLTNLQKENLVGALEDEILKLFPQPDKSFFYENLQKLLFKYIYNPPVSPVLNSLAPPAELMLNIISITNASPGNSSDGAITAAAIGGSGNYQYTLTGTPAGTPNPKPTFPIINTSGIFTKLPHGTYSVAVNDGTTTDNPPPAIPIIISANSFAVKITAKPTAPSVPGGADVTLTATLSNAPSKGTTTYEWINLETGLQIPRSVSSTLTGVGAGNYGVKVTNVPTGGGANTYAYTSITIKDPSSTSGTGKNQISTRGIKYYLDQLKGSGTKITSDQISSLETNIQDIIKIGISTAFDQMAEYGGQGNLMSTTYDCQIITRIADYTTALLNEINKEPKN